MLRDERDMLMLWFLATVALAGGDKVPTTCQVVFMGPTKYCSWDETLTAAATGPNEKKATRAATERLLNAAEAMAAARALQTAGTLAAAVAEPEKRSCPAAVEAEWRISCFPEPALDNPLTCFADFKDDDCWRPEMVIREGTGWRVREEAHTALCAEVRAGLRSELSSAAQQQCLARCELEANVRCPGLASAGGNP